MKSDTGIAAIQLESLHGYTGKRDSNKMVETWTRFARLNVFAPKDEMKLVLRNGVDALTRLLPIAMRDTGQSSVVAQFLLGLYNGPRFPFDMTQLRRLDHELLLDCISVLMMDATPAQEVHEYFENGGKIWEQMADDWGLNDQNVQP